MLLNKITVQILKKNELCLSFYSSESVHTKFDFYIDYISHAYVQTANLPSGSQQPLLDQQSQGSLRTLAQLTSVRWERKLKGQYYSYLVHLFSLFACNVCIWSRKLESLYFALCASK